MQSCCMARNYWRITLFVIALSASAGPLGAFADHFRSGIISYETNSQDPTLLDVTVTTTYLDIDDRNYWYDVYMRTAGNVNEYLFTTDKDDVLRYGQDPLYTRYIALRTSRSIPVPTDIPAIIDVWDCCRVDNLVGFGDYYGYSDYRDFYFSTHYVADAPKSIIVDMPPVMIAVKTHNSRDYSFVFVPAISPTGAPISCSINRGSAFTSPYELIAIDEPGGCSIGWANMGYSEGDKVPVGLRVMDTDTGQFNDLTFLVMVTNLNILPAVKTITTGGLRLPQHGGNITMYVG
ncbi:hypothetical protein Vretifemale_20146, partial [Volvox reticuliferus]